MDGEQWAQVKALLEAALEQPADQRIAWIEAHVEDALVRREVLELLRQLDATSRFLDTPPGAVACAVLDQAAAPTLKAGDSLADRFVIRRLLGRGGLGEVYEAEDLRGGTHVALKVIRAATADPYLLARLRDELILARAVTDRNVCRIFDLHLHTGPPEFLFLTMELIDGETLSERLARSGPLSPREAVEFARQLASGLSAVHAADVVHGDIKASNVMLTTHGEKLRAVLMDFGIAASDTGSDNGTTESVRGGTPAYMAPEQKDGTATKASDVYAFGLVLHEAVTGSRWGHGARRSRRAPQWFRAVRRRCLAVDPDKRFRDGQELCQELERWRRRPRWIAAAALAATLAAAAALAWWWMKPKPTPAAGVPTVAVLGFRNLAQSDRLGYLSLMLSVALDADLGSGRDLRVVPPGNVARCRTELGLADSETLPRDTLLRLRSDIGADLVVLGSYSEAAESGPIRVNVRVEDTRSGHTLGSFATEGSESQLPALFSSAGTRIRKLLSLHVPEAAEESVRAALPGSLEAMRLYAKGLQELRSFETLAARDDLEKAVAAEPEYPQAHSALSQVWAALGYDFRAKEEAEKAFRLRSRLSEPDRLLVEAHYYKALRDNEKAVEAYKRLLKLSPENPDYLLALVDVQKSDEALATIAQLRRMPAPVSADPRVDLAEARVADRSDQYTREETCARRAAAKAVRSGALLLAAQARLYEGWASRLLGKTAEAAAAYTEARDILLRVGDENGVGRALRGLALVAQYNGDLHRARTLYEQAFSTFRRIGSEEEAAVSVNGMAMVASLEGRIDDALRFYGQSLAICRETRRAVCIGTALNNLGYVHFKRGDLAAARREFEAAMSSFEDAKAKYGESFVLSSLGDLLESQGRRDEAERDIRQSLTLSRALGDRTSEASTEISLAMVLRDRAEFAAAIRLCQRAIAEQNSLGQRDSAARSRMVLGGIAIDAGRDQLARSELEKAVPDLQRAGRRDDTAVAEAFLSEALACLGSGDESRRTAELAVKTLAESQNRLARAEVLLATGRAAMRTRDYQRGKLLLSQCLSEANRGGFFLFATEARRELGRVDRRG